MGLYIFGLHGICTLSLAGPTGSRVRGTARPFVRSPQHEWNRLFNCSHYHKLFILLCFAPMLPKKMEQATSISSCSRNHVRMPDETGMEQVLSDLQALKRLYGLLHRGQADENLDETSRALLMRMLDDATQQALLRQAKMLSGPLMSPALERKLSIQPDRQTRDAEPRLGLKPVASPSPSLHASGRSRRLRLQSSVRSRDGLRVHDHRCAEEGRLLAHVASNLSSKTATPWHHPNPEQRIAPLRPHRSSRAAKTKHGTVSGDTSRGERRDRPRRSSGRGDHSSLERSGRGRSVSREPSTQGRARLNGRATAWHVGAEGSSTRLFGRLDSGLSASMMMSHRGSGRAGRGAAAQKRSSSSNGAVTIRSSIRPNRELMERCLRRADEEAEDESPPRRRRKDGAVTASVSVGRSSRPRRTLNRIDSGSTYSSSSSGAASSFPSTSPTVSSTSSASASSSSSPVSRRGNERPAYALEVSSTSRSRRHRERQERREGRLRRLKNKLALVFHHRHDHHHHHHFGRGRSGSLDGLSRRDRRTNHRMSPWRYLGGVFHRGKGHDGDKKTTSRTVLSVPAKRRGGGGGHVHALFDALVRHMWGARRAPARAGLRRTSSRVQVKKLHWWQRLRRQRGLADVAGSSRPRRRLGHGKAK